MLIFSFIEGRADDERPRLVIDLYSSAFCCGPILHIFPDRNDDSKICGAVFSLLLVVCIRSLYGTLLNYSWKNGMWIGLVLPYALQEVAVFSLSSRRRGNYTQLSIFDKIGSFGFYCCDFSTDGSDSSA